MMAWLDGIKQWFAEEFEVANTKTPYNDDDLETVYKALDELGYKKSNEAYAHEEKFDHVLFDFVKEEDGVRKGIITLHLDKGEKSGIAEDGVMEIAYDYDLQEEYGRVTGIKEFAEKYKKNTAQPTQPGQQRHFK